ncbi:MAG: PAS domain-containing protein, partial [Methylobacter sp.]
MNVIDHLFNRSQQDETAKFQLMLEKNGNGFMFFNANLVVSKVSQSADKLFSQHRQIFEKIMPNVDIQHLAGTSINNFTVIPDQVFTDLSKEHKSWSNIISLEDEKFQVSLSPLVDKQGVFKGGIFEFQCVTDHLKQEAEADRFKSVLQNMVTPVMTCDFDRRITSANPSLIKLLNQYKTELQKVFPGFDPEKLMGICIDSFHHDPEMQKRIFADPSKMPYKATIQVLEMSFNLTVFPVRDKQEKINGYAVEWVDCSAEVKANAEIKRVTNAAIAGQLSERINTTAFTGTTQEFGNSVNQLLDAIIQPLNMAAGYVDSISKGIIPAKITDTYNGDFNTIKDNLNFCIDELNSLFHQIGHMAEQHNLGDIDVTIDESQFQGSYQSMAKGVNDMVGSHIAVKKKAMAVFKAFGEGDFDASMEQLPGKKAFINDTIELVRSNLKAVMADINSLIKAAADGQLDVRADGSKHLGDFNKLMQGVNNILDAILLPIGEGNRILTLICGGDLRQKVEIACKGDHDKMKQAVNGVHDWLS